MLTNWNIMNISGQKKRGINMAKCEHDNTEYIPYESDTNVQEKYICLDCGINLPLPEEDVDEQIKEHTVRT